MGAVPWPRGLENWKFAGRGHGPVTVRIMVAQHAPAPGSSVRLAKGKKTAFGIGECWDPMYDCIKLCSAKLAGEVRREREEQHQQNGGQRN
jgi:hypothetical protein